MRLDRVDGRLPTDVTPTVPCSRFWFSPEMDVSVHRFRYQDSFDCPPHTHPEYNVTFCLDGSLEYAVHDQVYVLRPGDVLVINPGDFHSGGHGEKQQGTGVTVCLTVRALKRILMQMRFPVDSERVDVLFLKQANDLSVLASLQELVEEVDRRRVGYEMVAQSLVVQMMIHLVRHSLEPTLTRQALHQSRQLPSWQVVRALEYMNWSDKSSYSLTKLCAEIGTSPSRFIHLFNGSFNNLSPHTVHNQVVLAKAQRLLKISDLSIKEIAFELGFRNGSHFCKLFHNYLGMTPGTYRSQSDLSEPGLRLASFLGVPLPVA